MRMKRFLLLALVLSASIYLASCATSNEEQPTVAPTPPPAPEAVQPSPDETAKQEEIERERIRQQELEKQRKDEEERHMSEQAVSTTFIESLDKVYFDFDKSDVLPKYRDILSKNATVIKDHPAVKVVVEGHCDERGTAEYNLALGERRAISVKKYLVSSGVAENNLYTISYGEEKPADPGHNKEAWAKNRRVQFSKEE
jgi:peptidoglycan-associated lipoprotein